MNHYCEVEIDDPVNHSCEVEIDDPVNHSCEVEILKYGVWVEHGIGLKTVKTTLGVKLIC